MRQPKALTAKQKRAAATRYANALADLLGDKSAPPVLLDLAQVVCDTLDGFSAPAIEGTDGDDLDFQFADKATPEDVREKLPAMILKLWNWRAAHFQIHDLDAPKKGGAK